MSASDGADGAGSDGSSGSVPSGAVGQGPEGAEGRAPGDARLREAVAAWVATADDDTEKSSGGASGDNGGTKAGDGADVAADAGAVSAVSGSGAGSTPEAGGDGDPADRDGSSASDASARDGATDATGAGADGEREGEALPETGAETKDADGAASAAGAATEGAAASGSARAAGAATADTEGAPESGTADEPQAAAGAERAPSSVSVGDSAADVGPAANDADSTGAEPEADASPSAAAAAAASASARGTAARAEPGTNTGPGARTGAGTEPEADARVDSDAKPKAEASSSAAGSVSARGTAAKAGPCAGTEPEADADAKPKADASPSAAAVGAEHASGRDVGAESASEVGAQASVRDAGAAPKAADGASHEASDGRAADDAVPSTKGSAAAATAPSEAPQAPQAAKDTPGHPQVDQPTGVFRAPRRPAVDQPTTMLKLGDTKPPTDKPKAAEDKPKTADKPKPESPAERTSKFVALKPLDEPAPARPKANPGVPGGTAALPQVGPDRPQVGPERTTQQPLPPKPPLDLLAELTNTPPPRQTPVRTIVRRVKIWTPLVVLLAVIFAVVQAVRPLPAAALTLTADATYTFEGGTLDLPWPGQGQSAIEVEGVGSLGTDGKQTAAPIASVAKIMTAYVILQEHPLKGNEGGEKITVDQQAEDESKNVDESTAAMTKGQQFTERQMLQLLMIPSGNNAARLLARWDSDSKTFVGKMNDAAKKLGMTNSTYTDPSGLEKTTVSTATDQLKLAKEVMQNPVFAGIVGMASAKIPGLDGMIYNNNDLLVKQVGVTGLKTGSSTPAGGNLVWAATKTVNGKTQTVYGAVLGQNAGTGKVWDSLQLALTNSQKLIDKVQQSLTSATVVKKGDVVGYVDDQLGGQTPVVATKDMTAVGWPGLKTKLAIGTASGDTVPHSGKAGTVVGELTVGDGSDHAVTIPVALQSDLAEPGFGAKLTRVS
ncbi:serine hydrolase [Streptomyces sp. NPDC093544]|uniref:serine hydrolase n=1 Tax=Streptomyces sp. NPDC093544 TaxID=3155200 RepID=UPI00341D3C5C